jgi:5'-nucleotidase
MRLPNALHRRTTCSPGSRGVPLLAWTLILLLTLVSVQFSVAVCGAEKGEAWPQRVLITNDDGISDIKIIELARAFSAIAETYVVAPLEDRSGGSHYMIAFNTRELRLEPRELGDDIEAYGVDGFPADCVMVALRGILKNNPPDLVVSGINGGANLGFDWVGSGTIGAARIAALLGVPGIAVSGMREEIPGALEAATRWVVRLSQSSLVKGLQPGEYLTVSIPQIEPSKIKGVRVAAREGLYFELEFERDIVHAPEQPSENLEAAGRDDAPEEIIWKLKRRRLLEPKSSESDVALYREGYVVVVPMLADEHNYEMLYDLKRETQAVPEWSWP